MEKLLYIGKSNKKFTNGSIYDYTGQVIYTLVIKSKKGLIIIRKENLEYFDKNFKFIDEQEYDKLLRKNKLKKISKNGSC